MRAMRQDLLLGTAAWAALGAMTGAAAADAAGEAETGQLDAIAVYATRNPIPAFDYAGEVTVIPKDVIDDFNPSTLADIFDAVPGAAIGGGPRRSGMTPDVRGLSGEGVL